MLPDSSIDPSNLSTSGRDATMQMSLPAAEGSPAETTYIQSLHKQLQSAIDEIGILRQRALAESQSQASLSGLDSDPGA